MQIYKSWTNLKNLFNSKSKIVDMQYDEHDYYYRIFIIEAGTEYFTELWKDTSQVKGIDVSQNNTDLSDFEDNYKSSANQAVNMDVNVDNNINIASGDISIDDGYFKLIGDTDESGESYKGPVTIDEKPSGRYELAIKDEDVLSKIDDIYNKVSPITFNENSGDYNELAVKDEDVLSKLNDIYNYAGRTYDSVNEKWRLAVDANIHFEDDALVNIDNVTRRIWDGLVFEYSISFTKQINASQEYLLSIPSNYELHIKWMLSSELGLIFELYENPTITNNGSELSQINSNRNSSNTCYASLYDTPIYSNIGTKIRTTVLSGSQQSSAKGDSTELILKENTSYIIKIISFGNGNLIGYQHVFYERDL